MEEGVTVAVIEKEAVVAGWSGVEQWADRASQVDQRQPALGLQLRLSSGLHLLHGQCEQAV